MAHAPSAKTVGISLAVIVAAVVIVGVGALALSRPEAVRPLGRVLSIAVVAPVEPEVQPGETMEVGALNDGFDRAALERIALDGAAEPATDETYLPPDAYVGETWVPPEVPQMPRPTPVAPVRVSEKPPATLPARPVDPVEVEPRRADPLADGSRAYGFDRPRPDYAGERRLRWERLREQPQGETSPAQEKPTGPVPYYPQ